MLRKKKGGVRWLEFELFADIPNLRHGVFLRQGGVSTGDYSSLNLSYDSGDNPHHVRENLRKVQKVLKVDDLVCIRQEHGKHVTEAIGNEAFIGDAFTTETPGRALVIRHADCQAAIFYDPIHHAVANVHSGWRGSVQNIYAATIDFMRVSYGTQPENLLVGISPSLGPNHAEFVNYRQELPESFWEFQVKPNYFDFWGISTMQLRGCGVLPHHIEIAGICTYSHPEDYFSYRRDKARGRHGTIVTLLNP